MTEIFPKYGNSTEHINSHNVCGCKWTFTIHNNYTDEWT